MGDFEIELDRELLFRIRPHCIPDVNALGYRDHEFEKEKHGRRRILFFGDSFVLGAGVPPGQSLPKMLERGLGGAAEVLNLGVYGYGPDQELAAFLRDGVPMHPDLVLVGLYPGNDFEDLVKDELWVLDASGHVVRNQTNPVAAVLPRSALLLKARVALTGHFLDPNVEKDLIKRLVVDPFTRLGSPNEEGTRRRLSLMEAMLEMWKAETARRKIPLGVVMIPAYEGMQGASLPENNGVPQERFFVNEDAAWMLLQEVGLRAVDLRGPFLGAPGLTLYNERDRHLSPAGNALAAAVVTEFIRPLW
jgi:SGNH hydrolase-like domain, acetyltransferase AlgX